MSTLPITPQLKATMLKQLVAGHDLDFVARAAQMPRDRVLDVVANHGYPDAGQMAWAADALLSHANKIPGQPATNGHRPGVPLDGPATDHKPQTTLHAQSTGHDSTNSGRSHDARPVHTSTAELLHQAGESVHARTRCLGAKISALLADLTSRLAEEQEAHEAKVKAERENAQVAARIAALEAEIAALKGKRGKARGRIPSSTGQIPSESAAIRAWARANNVPCPRVGVVPKDVRTAHSAAVGGAG